MSKTTFSNKCDILAELWVEWRNTAMFGDFIAHHDVGLPLAWSVSNGMATVTTKGQDEVEEAWSYLLEILGIKDDKELTNLDDVLYASTLDFD